MRQDFNIFSGDRSMSENTLKSCLTRNEFHIQLQKIEYSLSMNLIIQKKFWMEWIKKYLNYCPGGNWRINPVDDYSWLVPSLRAYSLQFVLRIPHSQHSPSRLDPSLVHMEHNSMFQMYSWTNIKLFNFIEKHFSFNLF